MHNNKKAETQAVNNPLFINSSLYPLVFREMNILENKCHIVIPGYWKIGYQCIFVNHSQKSLRNTYIAYMITNLILNSEFHEDCLYSVYTLVL